MSALFADTYFFVAYLNPKDDCHDLAVHHMTMRPERIVTTVWVLAELGNFLAGYRSRRLFVPLVRRLRGEHRVVIVPASNGLFERGLALYGRCRDKDWSVTDCISFTLMKEKALTQALTGDHHFEQAGFAILFKPA
jgi:uncharacterized protein